jgi:protein SCO1/2
MRWGIVFVGLMLGVAACKTDRPLPILGEREVVAGDTVYHTIPDFSFVNQDSQIVTPATFAGKAYVVDFFFTSCPTICPKVKRQMMRVVDRFKTDERLLYLSHSIDTKYDTVGQLNRYKKDLGVDAPQWHFVTGEKPAIYKIANDYFSVAKEDPDAPGGFDHSGRLILVDEQRRVRAFCDGTDAADVDRFMNDIQKLLDEMAGH